MFVHKSLVALLAFCIASAVSTHPTPEGVHKRHVRARAIRARSCKPHTLVSSSAISTTSGSTPTSTDEASTSRTQATSSTLSSSSPSPSPTTNTASNTNSALAVLAPLKALQSWSTSPDAKNALPLSDSTFNPFDLLSALSHSYVNAPDGRLSMKATYPEGSYNFQHDPQGGFSFYAPGPSNVDLTTAKEVTLGYSVFFEDGFDFNIGGKLPGIYGGDSDDVAVSCSGGRRDNRCFSSRMMWRTKGAGEMYTYLPPAYDANDNVCNIPPFSTCNDEYGASVGRGSFTFEAGKSNPVSMRIRLNDAGQQNGELELWANGQSVINVGGLVLRDSDDGRIRGIQMQTFFGGSDTKFASPKTQSSYFRDFTVAITEKL
ncbi:hypothetical protein PHLCEN_2v13233 [Hermanssonia centrifuga]|uniref:Polysaccharide lyase 14 domain-containing protein n=1 Tax=Hermanssonia centrifuga TaxID=98765 RepID=A0A2R6NEY2_9APHY|nr:hypothetical protein PHLCEN_2v13233 [Hermanssonia centrifuga]